MSSTNARPQAVYGLASEVTTNRLRAMVMHKLQEWQVKSCSLMFFYINKLLMTALATSATRGHFRPRV
jgi:hypothetical protein